MKRDFKVIFRRKGLDDQIIYLSNTTLAKVRGVMKSQKECSHYECRYEITEL